MVSSALEKPSSVKRDQTTAERREVPTTGPSFFAVKATERRKRG